MKLEEQVLTIEQAKHLRELGLDMSDAALCWAIGEMVFKDMTIRHQSVVTMDSKPQQYAFIKELIPTYTLQEMWSRLPKIIIGEKPYKLNFDNYECVMYYESILKDKECLYSYDGSYSLMNCVYDTLCWVLENKYLKEEKK